MYCQVDFATKLIDSLVVGGVLADPSMTLPALFGSKALFGCKWMRTYPYALPGIINAAVLALTAGMVFLGIEEV